MDQRVTKQQYVAAADRIRTGRGLVGDHAICDAWDAQWAARPRGPAVRSIYDLPIARRMWNADRRDAMRGASLTAPRFPRDARVPDAAVTFARGYIAMAELYGIPLGLGGSALEPEHDAPSLPPDAVDAATVRPARAS